MDGGNITMSCVSIYIAPDSEDTTGFVTYVSTVTNTSSFESYSYRDDFPEELLVIPEKEDKVYVFPPEKERHFLDKELADFYKKKGYKV